MNEFKQAQDCLLPMGITSENVAQRYGVTRKEQDQAAVSLVIVYVGLAMLLPIIDLALAYFTFRLTLTRRQLLPLLLVNLGRKLFQ